MSIIKLLSIVIFTFLLLTLFSQAETTKSHEDRVIEMCEAWNIWAGTSTKIYCVVSELYALNRVETYFWNPDKSEKDEKKLNELFDKHTINRYKTYDFVKIDLEYSEYLEGKKRGVPYIPAE